MIKIISSFLIIFLLLSWSVITFVGLSKDERKKFLKQFTFGLMIFLVTFGVLFGLSILF